MQNPIEKTPHEKFTKALASVLSVNPETIRDVPQDAKDEEPSPHKRYSYSPEEAGS
jgi:hypothetical protein